MLRGAETEHGAASASEWLFVHSLALVATSAEEVNKQRGIRVVPTDAGTGDFHGPVGGTRTLHVK